MSFFQPWQWGEGAIFQSPHCLSHLSLPPICSTLCMLSFPCGYQLQGWCCPPGFLCVNRALDVILSTLPPCTPLWYQYCLFFILICRYKALLYVILPSHLSCLIPSIFSAESNIPCRALNTTAPSHSPCPHQLLNFQILKYTMDSP